MAVHEIQRSFFLFCLFYCFCCFRLRIVLFFSHFFSKIIFCSRLIELYATLSFFVFLFSFSAFLFIFQLLILLFFFSLAYNTFSFYFLPFYLFSFVGNRKKIVLLSSYSMLVFTPVLAVELSPESEPLQVSSGLLDSSQYSGWCQQCCSLYGLGSSSNFQLFQSPFQSFRDFLKCTNYNGIAVICLF